MSPACRALLFLVPICTVGCAKSLSHTFDIPKEKVEQKLAQKFPLQPEKEAGDEAPVKMTLSDPVVLLEEGRNQIGLRVNVLVEPLSSERPPGLPRLPPLPKPRLTGTISVFCSVAYDVEAKAIRLSDPKISSLKIDQLPDRLETLLSRLAEKALAQKLAEQPIPLGNTTMLDKGVRTFLKSVTVKDGKLLVEVGW